MLQLMRTHAKNWLMKVVLGIIIIVFVFYFGSMRERQTTETIAEIDGARISYAEFKNEHQYLLDLYRQRHGDNLTEDILKKINPKQQAFDNLINRATILSKANDLKLDVSDDELKAFILYYPAFQRNGVFNNNLYQRVLRYQRMTPEEFEVIQRRALKTGKLERLIKESVKVSDKEVQDIYNAQSRKVNLNFIEFTTDNTRIKTQPSREELETYLKDHGEQFRVPQKALIEYFALKGESFGNAVDILDEEIDEYYDSHKSEFEGNGETKPLTKLKGEIISKLKSAKGMDAAFEKATVAHDTIYQEENFEEYATGKSLDIETSAFFRDVPPTGKLAGIHGLSEYVFNLEEGDLGRVFSDGNAHYIFKLVSLAPSHIPELSEIAKKVNENYIANQRKMLCRKRAEGMLDSLKGDIDIAKLAIGKNLKLSETGFFSPGPNIPKIGYSQALEEAISGLSEKEPYPDNVFHVNGKYFVIKFKEEGKPDKKEWETKKDYIKDYLLRLKGKRYLISWLEGAKKDMISKGKLKIHKKVEDL
ncbi:MAG: SurA N-terminal domain-containing protein [Thermodesulfobacteriota bacterium]|nr:SurA N-terminal domain-containing protein [Thermodesulfobacteriota bacterium]